MLRITVCVFLCFCSNINAQPWYPYPEKGFSDQYRSESSLGDYAFGYNEDHSSGGSFRRETGDRYGNKIGSYGLRIADGRMRVVNYIADHNGYRANIVSNEPGIYSQDNNGYLEVTKGSIHGLLIPGFSFSSDPPHTTFDIASDHDTQKENEINRVSAYALATSDVGEDSEQNSLRDAEMKPLMGQESPATEAALELIPVEETSEGNDVVQVHPLDGFENFHHQEMNEDNRDNNNDNELLAQ